MPGPSGNKLLYFSDWVSSGWAWSFIAFDREGYGNLYEEGVGWNNAFPRSLF